MNRRFSPGSGTTQRKRTATTSATHKTTSGLVPASHLKRRTDPGVGSDGSGGPHGVYDGRATPRRTGPPGSWRADDAGAAKKQCSCGKDARSLTIKLVRRGKCLLESKMSFMGAENVLGCFSFDVRGS